MSDNEKDLTMRLQFLADTKGAADAAKTIDDLRKKAGDTDKKVDAANKTLGQAGQVAGRAAEQIGTVAGAMGSAGGAAGQAAAGVRLLSGAIQTMTTAGGGLAGLLAAVALLATSALVNWLVKVSGETKKLNEQAGKTNEALTAMSKITLDAITAQQEKMRKSASGTADQYERILQAKNRMLSAQEQNDLAQLDYEKAVDLARAPKSDPFAARRIEAEYAAKAAAVSSDAERQRQNNQVAVAESKVKALREQAALADSDAAQKAALQSHEQQRLENLKREKEAAERMSKSERDRYGSLYPAAGAEYDKKAADITQSIGELEVSLKDIATAIAEAKNRGASARDQIPSAELDVLTERTVRAGNDIRDRAQGVQSRNAVGDINYDQDQATAEAKRKLRDGEISMRDRREQDKELSQKVVAEQADVRRVGETGKGDAAKERKERDAAIKALQEFRRDSTVFYSDLRAEMEKMREAIRNNPSQAQ